MRYGASVAHMSEPAISNVSDTARWVAVYRAWETARPDALFRDPFAERLAGERGKEIVRTLGRMPGTANGWPMITRTKLIDDLVLQSIADGCDCGLESIKIDDLPFVRRNNIQRYVDEDHVAKGKRRRVRTGGQVSGRIGGFGL